MLLNNFYETDLKKNAKIISIKKKSKLAYLNELIMIKKLLFSTLLTLAFYQQSEAQTGLKFDGTNDYVQTNYNGIIGSGARTVEAWIKTTSSTSSAQKVITDWGSSATGGRFTLCMLQNNSIRLEVGGNGIPGTVAFNNGAWHHVAAVFDPSLTSNQVKLYIDGNLNASGNLTVAVNTTVGTNLRIGQRFDGVNLFNGSINEVRIWNVARTANEILANKNIEFCAPQAGLVAYYKLNEGTADGTNTSITSVTDFSGNTYTGTLYNFALTGSSSNFVSGAPLIQNINSLVTITGGTTITANQSGAAYQWIDCSNGNSPIAGATSQSFTPSTNGNYAVQINYNDCNATSSCSTITLSNIDNDFKNSIQYYPNPTNGATIFSLGRSFESIEATIFNVTGQVIKKVTFGNTKEITVDFEGTVGIYFIEIATNTGEKSVLKIMKK